MDDDVTSWGPDDVAAYLYYGYLPRIPQNLTLLPGWGLAATRVMEGFRYDDLVQRGMAAFASAFDELPDGPHIVPLSGGLDSRAILAELRRRVPATDITAVTVGSPGSLDFELSTGVAAAAGVRHVRIDLAQHHLTAESLLSTAAKNAVPTWVLDAMYNRLIRERLGDDAVYWSGYLGSRLSSTKHLADDPDITFERALDRFVELNRWSRSARLHPPDADLRRRLPAGPLAYDSSLGHDEQLDLWIRQEHLTRPVNLPTGFRHQAPFTQERLSTFLLSIPRMNGLRQRVYRDVLLYAYPDLFTLPTTAAAGLALKPSRISRVRSYGQRAGKVVQRRLFRKGPDVWQVNYLDLAHALRHRPDYRDLVRGCLQNLMERGVTSWLDIERIWNEHQRGDADHAMALTLLVSLDIHLDLTERGS